MKLLNKFNFSLFSTLTFYSHLWAVIPSSTQKTFNFICSEKSIVQLTEKAKSSMEMSRWLYLKQKAQTPKNIQYLATFNGNEELTLSVPQLTISFEIRSNSFQELKYYSNRVDINYTETMSDTELWENIQKTFPKKSKPVSSKANSFSFLHYLLLFKPAIAETNFIDQTTTALASIVFAGTSYSSASYRCMNLEKIHHSCVQDQVNSSNQALIQLEALGKKFKQNYFDKLHPARTSCAHFKASQDCLKNKFLEYKKQFGINENDIPEDLKFYLDIPLLTGSKITPSKETTK